ncbi:hypothetical protein Q3A66_00440 [Hymenobacter sp. BT770]|uniref:hypothetical protein n=1 Tax=Hymenobacter sp. BT770 TaxID=2886942 RepID=UPI001D1199D2|nr:hypothetical protein [Hymenobacter sp. BT770]MCC3151863.1 hypothetical protein [Hymenobacter sp. BT770]MDO3413515.1 hypothetical protein [Hymenobacter sp. BT770]
MLPLSFRYFGLLATGLLVAATAQAQAPVRSGPVPAAPSDEQSYRKEFVYGVNFNTQGGLLGGVSLRSSRVLDDRLLRFWSIEGVMLKNAKEDRINTIVGGSYIDRKTNYAFVLRPSLGLQRILFRKAADAGVQVNGLVSAGPSFGLLMPYYISFDRTATQTRVINVSTDDIVNEQYDPVKHADTGAILDRGPLFSGIGETKVVPGFHLRTGLSFEYGRYRDAVTGMEVGFLVEGYTKRLLILSPGNLSDTDGLNRQIFPSVYLTLYFGHRS